MNAVAAVATLASIIQTVATLSQSAAQISDILQKMHAAGRSDLTPEELDSIAGHDLAARVSLASAITQAMSAPK